MALAAARCVDVRRLLGICTTMDFTETKRSGKVATLFRIAAKAFWQHCMVHVRRTCLLVVVVLWVGDLTVSCDECALRRFNREKHSSAVAFCTRVLNMFVGAPGGQGKIPEDTQMRAKYLYLRGQAHLGNVSDSDHIKVSRAQLHVYLGRKFYVR